MVIYIAADHRGFPLKEHLKPVLDAKGYEGYDLGNAIEDSKDDYPDFAALLGEKVSRSPENARGILICAGGTGMCIAVNKFKHVRATLGISPDQVYSARHDDDINVLCIASDFTDKETAEKIMEVFLVTPFGGDERYRRRLDKIAALEK